MLVVLLVALATLRLSSGALVVSGDRVDADADHPGSWASPRAVFHCGPREFVHETLLSELHVEQGRPEKALGLWERALEVDPRHVETLCWLGVMHDNDGRLEEARRLLERGLEADPRHVGTLANLGLLHDNEGRPEEARPLWERALEVNPGDSAVCSYLAELDNLQPTHAAPI